MERNDGEITVLHLSWEFPPFKVGGLGTHVYNLSRAQAKVGLKPIVLTCGFNGLYGKEETKDGFTIYRINADKIPAENFFAWVLQMNMLLQFEAARIFRENRISIIHAHDWLVTTTAVALKHIYRVPLVGTIHALESGRYGGIRGDRQVLIHDLEAKLVFEAWRVICCSNFMKYSVVSTFGTPENKIDVVPNGVNAQDFDFEFDEEEFKSRYALPDEKIVLFVGRHVWEKGLDILMGAVPMILAKHPEAKFVVTGDGYLKPKCEELARQNAPEGKVLFTGYVDDDTLKKLMRVASVIVVPSRYEPFGIVALESMAARTPVVVADTGGLGEIVEHDKTGIKVWVDNSESVAWGVNYVLDEANAQKIKEIVDTAHKIVREKYNWEYIAKGTKSVYSRVLEEYEQITWKPRPEIFGWREIETA